MSETPTSTEQPELHCPECDYNLTGAPGDRCPWCGWRIEIDLLIQAAGRRSGATRWSLGVTAASLGALSLIALAALLFRSRELSLADAVTVLGVLVAGVAHLWLAAVVCLSRGQWPLRHRESGTIFRAIGWGAIVAGCFGASQALAVSPGARGVEGIVMSGVLEFVLRATFFTMPGWTLLALRAVAFRPWYGSHVTRGSAKPGQPSPRDVGARFTVDALGRYEPSQVSWIRSHDQRPTTPAIEAAIARIWEAESAVAKTADQQAGCASRDLHNGRLVRMIDVTTDETAGDLALPTSKPAMPALRFTFGETCYRDFLGTNLSGGDLTTTQNQRGFADQQAGLASPLGISAVIVTTDGYLALGRRSHRVASHRGWLHLFGGMLEPTDLAGASQNDGQALTGSIIREVCEELGLAGPEVVSMLVIGLIRDRAIHQPELIFDAPITLTRDELTRRFADTADSEHSGVEFAADDPESLPAFLQTANRMTPVAEAGVLLHGRNDWGESWYEQACHLLYGEMPPRNTRQSRSE